MSQKERQDPYKRDLMVGGVVLAVIGLAYALGRNKQPTAANESSSGFFTALNHVSLSLFGGVEKKTGLSRNGLTAASAVGLLGIGYLVLSGNDKRASNSGGGHRLSGGVSANNGGGVGDVHVGDTTYHGSEHSAGKRSPRVK